MKIRKIPMGIKILCTIDVYQWIVNTKYWHDGQDCKMTWGDRSCMSCATFNNVQSAKKDWLRIARKWGLKKGVHWEWEE